LGAAEDGAPHVAAGNEGTTWDGGGAVPEWAVARDGGVTGDGGGNAADWGERTTSQRTSVEWGDERGVGRFDYFQVRTKGRPSLSISVCLIHC
jgi:hypothetical protein